MKILDDLLAKFGSQTVIIVCICILLVIFAMIVYRMFKLKKYRKEIIELENQMNAVKSLPIQYRLGRVKGIGKNMPEVLEKYNLYIKEFDDLNSFQTNDIVPLINEIDEQLYYRKLAGVKSKLYKLKEKISNYETKSQDLLKRIEVITEVENEQRLEIIKIKEKYRAASDNFANVRFKIEDFVPSIPEIFNEIDERFVVLEEMMNNQRFDEAKTYAGKIEKDVDILAANLRDLPTYISIVRKYIPKRLEEIYAIIEEMKEKDFSIEKLSAASRYNQIGNVLEQTIQNIKDLKLENVGASIEKMTEDLNDLTSDLEKEQTAFHQYEEARNNCYRHIGRLDDGLKKTVSSLSELQENYLLADYKITIAGEYNKFKPIVDDLARLTEVIESKNFSYSALIDEFNDLIKRCQPFDDALIKYNELESSLRLEEKRALDELDNINIVLLEIKSEIKNKHLPMISESYKDYIDDSYQKADEIMKFIRHRPIDLKRLSEQVDAARDVIYKLYDNVHNLIVTAEMVEEAIIYGNRYRSSFLEVNTELTKAELLFRNGEYTKALSTAVDIIEKIDPGSYEMLINKNTKSE
ncbi:MAG: septation ring formation regulator EzrA [[Clostridium] spiroforme]|uniref:Septation ring formation regulator EzrA n=3 Tax=Thomasclavelia TaxID=3025755 RepID=A0A943I5R6_9FIRM|nr:septation ring formation regulator EzrA [Thomasclavelia spiroformis]MBS5587770.1 septation ring formation regulator EzrA [Thomasclavelia spiroformis]